MDLFINTNEYAFLGIDKTAGEVELPEDPNNWPQEILDELYKQVPFVADFSPHVVMDKVDAERAFGFGYVEVSNKSEAQMGTDPAMMSAAGIRTVRIPIVIKEGKLATFDLLINDAAKAFPLTESRLRQAIFRPQAFDVTSQTPGDISMIGQLYPPYRQNYGFGGGGMSVPADGMGKQGSAHEEELFRVLESTDGGFRGVKEAGKVDTSLDWALGDKPATAKQLKEWGATSTRGKDGSERITCHGSKEKKASILEAIAPTINASDHAAFWQQLNDDRGLQAAYEKNACSHAALMCLSVPPITKTASARNYVKPTVTQVISDDDGYVVKSASHLYWDINVEKLGRAEVISRYGEKVALAADVNGAATLAEGAEAMPVPEAAAPESVVHAGVYKVKDEHGIDLVGYVIPNLLDTNGMPLPLALFTNGKQTTVQADILGEPVTDVVKLPTAAPTGTGSFFEETPEGTRATIPMTLKGSYAGEGGDTFAGETYDGRPIEVSIQPNLASPTGMEEGKLLLPLHWKWTPLDAEQVALMGGEKEDELSETTEGGAGPGKLASAFVTIRSDGSTFSISGPVLEKMASEDRSYLNVDEAMFLLCGLGVEPAYGVTKLAHAMNGNNERVHIGRAIILAAEQLKLAHDNAAAFLRNVPNMRVNLVKEAALLPDPSAVDSVLSLNFINPENLLTFVGYLPNIDAAQSKMCELLLAARLGVRELPTSALERAVRSTEEVIEGLKCLAFQR